MKPPVRRRARLNSSRLGVWSPRSADGVADAGKPFAFTHVSMSSTASASAHGDPTTSVIKVRRSMRRRMQSGTHEWRGLISSGRGLGEVIQVEMPVAAGQGIVNGQPCANLALWRIRSLLGSNELNGVESVLQMVG